MNEKETKKIKEAFKLMRNDIFFFIEKGFGKLPQPLLPKYKNIPIEDWEAKHFGSVVDIDEHGIKRWEFPTFDKKKHLTWQQTKVLHYVNQSKNLGIHDEKSFKWQMREFKKMIAVVSGRGIGKTYLEALIILWCLLQHRDSQGAVTSYSRELIYDILWKELAKTVRGLHEDLQPIFKWQATRLVVNESPETWFISAKTGTKENPEALAGMHGPFVLIMADEASGVPSTIFETALDGLSEENYLVFMASNGRRLTGFFYDRCNDPNNNQFEILQFSSLESPIYKMEKAIEIVKEVEESGGIESDRFRVEVLGGFPRQEGLDDKGFKPLLTEDQLNIVDEVTMTNPKRLCIDYAGKGRDTTIWVELDEYSARIIHEEKTSDDNSIDQKSHMILTKSHYQDIIGDSFGIGAPSLIRLSKKHDRVKGKNVGEPPQDKKKFANMKAEAYWNMREWIIKGANLERHKRWKDILNVRYAENRAGKIQIMDKQAMRRMGYKSPDAADALMLGFTEPIIDYDEINRKRDARKRNRRKKSRGGYNMSAAGY